MTAPCRQRCLIAALPLAMLVAGCASRLPPAPPDAAAAVAADQRFAGRLAMAVAASERGPAQSLTAGFELRGRPEAGEIALETSLGTLLAQARWSRNEALLVTPQGSRRFTDLDDLSREALGEALPLAALFDWLRGRPWPGAASQQLSADRTGFGQLGWEVDLGRFADGMVAARRPAAPAVQLRVQLER